MMKWILILLVLAVAGGGLYIGVQPFPAPTQPIEQELSHDTFLPAE